MTTTQLSDQQQLTIEDEQLLIGIEDSLIGGDRQWDVPTIVVQSGIESANWSLRMTWNEARLLAAAITEVVDVAENG